MIISFAWTTPALLAGAKTMTRREWHPDHAARFKAGQLVDAWDHSPRVRSARKVATIRLTRAPWYQTTQPLGDEDFLREGFSWLVLNGSADDRDRVQFIWNDWSIRRQMHLWVVEFELVDVVR